MERRGRGLMFWLIVALIAGAVVNAFLSRQREVPPDPASAAAGTPAAPRPPEVAYALDTTRSNWPPLEEGAPAEGAAGDPAAINYYIVLDGSGSMRKSQCSGSQTKIDAAVAALQTFVKSIPADNAMGLAAFDGRGLYERVALAPDNRESMAGELLKVVAGGGTPLHSAISLGFEKLTRQARRQLGYGEYHLVVVTDGHADPTSEDPTRVVNKILNESPVLLHTVGFCIGSEHVLNQPGRVFYAAADSPEQLRQGLEAVLAESPSFDVSRFGR